MKFLTRKNRAAATLLLLGASTLGGCGSYKRFDRSNEKKELKVNNNFIGELGSKRGTSIKQLNLLTRLPSPSVGLVQFKTIEAPVILPAGLPDPALLFQIYRCNAETKIRGAVNEFDELGASSRTEAQLKEFFSKNMFWEDVKLKCEAVSDAQPQIEFVDLTAPSGDWRWFVRACLPNLESKSFLCSEAVAATEPLLGFRNGLESSKRELLTRMTNRISAIRQIAASLPVKAAALAEAYERCNTSDWEKTKRLLKRSILANVISYGSAILIDILAPNSVSQRSPYNRIADRIDAIWNTKIDTVQTGQAITRILLWLFTSKDDFRETCSTAEEIKINTAVELYRIKDLQLLLAADTEEAQRIGLDIPEGLLP
ncbi:MAG: hypothetical protein FJY29_09385 [Betaproteobacteria bacterium]|nr:hypothetical protein [Betaproteobacteria bacterium]